jgi:hypothetical protein
MTATIHLFDEFLLPPEEYTPEYLHQKRVRLEPLVFNVLRQKYGSLWREHWLNYIPPANAEHCVVIIERRIHEHLELLLHNVAYYAPTWSIAIVCSNMNYSYCRAITAPHEGRIHLIRLFNDSPSRDQARDEYNSLLKSAEFYERLPWSGILIAQTDSYLRKPLPSILFNYDYIASPTSWDETHLVGGLSYRNCDAMTKICKTFTQDIPSEDVFICEGAKALGCRIPTFDEANPIFGESCLYKDPVGVHQWWTFFHIHFEFAKEVFHALLTCEVNP